MRIRKRETIVLESIGDRQMYSYTTLTPEKDVQVNRTEQQAVMLVGAVLGSAINQMKKGDIITVDVIFEKEEEDND